MSGRAEPSSYVPETDPMAEDMTMSVALIGPNEAHRKIVSQALAQSEARSVREFAAYPSLANDVPRLLREHYEVVMIDLDSDTEYALQLVEKLAAESEATVMVYSSQNSPELLARSMRAGAKDFLPLPADPEHEAEVHQPVEPEHAPEAKADAQPSNVRQFPKPGDGPARLQLVETHVPATPKTEPAIEPEVAPAPVMKHEPVVPAEPAMDAAQTLAASAIAYHDPFAPRRKPGASEPAPVAESAAKVVPEPKAPAAETVVHVKAEPTVHVPAPEAAAHVAPAPTVEKKDVAKVEAEVTPDDFSKWDESYLYSVQPSAKTGTASERKSKRGRERAEEVEIWRPEEELPPKKDWVKWVLIAVVPVIVAVVLSLYFMKGGSHTVTKAAPAPQVQQAAQPAESQLTPLPPEQAAQPVTAATKPSAAVPENGQQAVPRGPQVSAEAMNQQLNEPSRIAQNLKQPNRSDEPPPPGSVAFEGGNGAPVMGGGNRPKVVSIAPISAGVAEGMLVQRVAPVYPQIAKLSRVSGTVTVGATITKAGTVTNVRALAGPPMLRQAAVDAVKNWRYRPYKLNNQPVDVETSINVVFALGQ